MAESEARNHLRNHVNNNLPKNRRFWSTDLIDTIGIRKVLTTPTELVRTEWSLCSLSDTELSRIDELVRICSLPCVDFSTVEEIPYYNARPYRQWVQEWFPKIKVKELKLYVHVFRKILHLTTQLFYGFNRRYTVHHMKLRGTLFGEGYGGRLLRFNTLTYISMS